MKNEKIQQDALLNLEQSIDALKKGKVIAYPTESVFGLGCDPDNQYAIKSLLSLKNRSKEKGLILISADFSQLEDYVDLNRLSGDEKQAMLATWPGPVTWVVPVGKNATTWLTGSFNTLAVRVCDHPDVRALCRGFGKPIISTSANLSGQDPCRTFEDVLLQFGDKLPYILKGKTMGRDKPTQIRDARSGKLLREG